MRVQSARTLQWVICCLFAVCFTLIYSGVFPPRMTMGLNKYVPLSTRQRNNTPCTRQESKQMSNILLQELERYTTVIESVEMPSGDKNKPTDVPRHLDVESETYLEQVKSVRNIRTILLNVSMSTAMGLVNTKTYAVHSNDCKRFQSRVLKPFVSNSLHKLPCLEGTEYQYHDTSIEDIEHYDFKIGLYDFHLGLQPPKKMVVSTSKVKDHATVGYLQVVKDAYILQKGDYITGGTYNSITRCHREDKRKRQRGKVPTYEKVFSIAQYWGHNFYHFTAEDLPRIVLSLPFLLKHKEIKIHLFTTGNFETSYLSSLGICEDRIISGDVRAKTAYVPNGSFCGHGQVISNNIQSVFLRAALGPEHIRDTIVLIKRSYTRWFGNHDSILEMVKSIAQMYNLRVEIFRDDPPPDFNVTRIMFNRAAVIVAPHGSGLANMIFAQPGTCIIEGVCWEPPTGIIVHCFRHLAQVLGHRYHGVVPPNNKNCKQTEPSELAPHIQQCLKDLLKGNCNSLHFIHLGPNSIREKLKHINTSVYKWYRTDVCAPV